MNPLNQDVCQTVVQLYPFYHLGRVDPGVGTFICHHLDNEKCESCIHRVADYLMNYEFRIQTKERSLDDDEPDDPVDWY